MLEKGNEELNEENLKESVNNWKQRAHARMVPQFLAEGLSEWWYHPLRQEIKDKL